MEIEELKEIWKNYDKKLDKIELVNRKILESIISKKTEKRLFWMKLQSIYSILLVPIITIFVIIPFAFRNEINTIEIIGVCMLSVIFIFLFINTLLSYKLMHLLKPALNTIVETKKTILKIKQFALKSQKQRIIVYSLMVLSLLLMISKSIDFKEPEKIAILIIMVIGIYFLGKLQSKLYFHNQMEIIEKEISEIEELKEE